MKRLILLGLLASASAVFGQSLGYPLTTTGGGSGTVTSASVTTANGVSASVANATTTPAFTFSLAAITPLSITGSSGNLTIAPAAGNNDINLNSTGTGYVYVSGLRISGADTSNTLYQSGAWGFGSNGGSDYLRFNGAGAASISTTMRFVGHASAAPIIAGTLDYDTTNNVFVGSYATTTRRMATTTGTEVLTNKDETSGTNTFPTFNQNTTGSAATLTTARTIAGVSFNGSANIAVPSTGLSDTSNLPRLDASNVFTGTRQSAPHFASTTSAPAAVASTAGAGAGPPTVTVTGTDVAFHAAFTTGASGTTGSSTVFTVTFATPFATTPVVIGPIGMNNNTGVTQGSTKACIVGSVSTTGFVLTSGGVALVVSTPLDFGFVVIGQP